MKSFTVDEITQIVGGMLTKVASPEITQIAPPLLSDEHTLALALGEDEIANLAKSSAKAALVPLGVQIDGLTTIEVERPRLAMMKLLNLFYVPPVVNKDIHPTAVVDPSAKLGANVCIGPNVVIGENECCIAEYAGTIASDEVFSNANQYSGGYELMTSLQLGDLQPYVLINTKEPLENGVEDYDGLPTSEVKKVGDCSGYIQYSFINASGCRGTDAEKTEIENLLKSGINVNTAGSGVGN